MTMGVDNWGSRKPPVGAALDWSKSINQDLLACWLANEGGGSTLYDLTRQFDATNTNGVTWGSGLYSNAITLAAASSQYFKAGPFVSTSNLSLCAWVVLNSLTGSNQGFMSFTKEPAGGTNVRTSLVYRSSFSQFGLWDNANTWLMAALTPQLKKWYFIAGTCHSLTSRKIFVNGVLMASDTPGSGTPTATYIYLGAEDSDLSEKLDGNLDNIRFYNRALTTSEIMQLYMEPFAGIALPRRRLFPATTAVAAQTYPRWRQGMHGRGPHWKQGMRYT